VGEVPVGPARGNASAKSIRRGVKGGISLSRTCQNCAGFVLYSGWNMQLGVVLWQMACDALIALALASIPLQLYFLARRLKVRAAAPPCRTPHSAAPAHAGAGGTGAERRQQDPLAGLPASHHRGWRERSWQRTHEALRIR